MAPSRILVVVTPFNRRQLIELTSRYPKRIVFDSSRFSFVASDDCSTEYGLAFLKSA
jgi:hypothetical protein